MASCARGRPHVNHATEISNVPELPEVEQAARTLRRAAVGRPIARVTLLHPSLRRKLSRPRLETIAGAVIARVVRRGKHQLLELQDGRTIHVHFRMAGDWDIGGVDEPLPAHARATIDFTDGTRVSLVDPRALSTLTLHATGESPLPELGPEPSDRALTAVSLKAALSRRNGPIKPVLLDQRIIAGVGNIYASEALWRARMSPRAIASGLTAVRLRRLLGELRLVLGPAARLPGRYKEARGSRRIAVYGRAAEPCRRCARPIERIVQAGRSTFYCPHCQAS
jgi:formamidopyrimidine-DNA glycosylase